MKKAKNTNLPLVFVENELKVTDFIRMKDEAFNTNCDILTAKASLNGSLYLLHVELNGEVIGMARIVGDGGYVNFLADVIVIPKYQGLGIGSKIMKRIISHVKTNIQQDSNTMIAIFSAKGKEGFYEKFGFLTRADRKMGHGMSLDIV